MEDSSRSKTGSKYDTRTILCRVFTVFAYIAFGSGIFHLLERDAASRRVAQFEEYYNKTMAAILSRCTSNQTEINITMTRIRQTFMQDVFPKEWDGWGGVNITVQAMTTIGYGNTVPQTEGGRIFLMVFASIGIPLTVIMLAAIGDRLKHLIRSLIITFERRILKRKRTSNIKKKTLLAVFLTTVVAHVAFSAAAPVHNDWDFTLALYVWFVTMTTIGFGDFVPHQTSQTASVDSVFVTIYLTMVLFTCLALVATVLQASSDWADRKKPPTKDEIKLSLKRMASSVSKKKKKPSTSTLEGPPRPYLVYSNYRNTDY